MTRTGVQTINRVGKSGKEIGVDVFRLPMLRVMVLNTTFNNFSATSCRGVLDTTLYDEVCQ